METEIDLSFLENYASSFSHTALSNFFESQEKASGKDLLQITPVEQINLFIIKDIFDEWKRDTKRIQSPFFNYQSEEVQQALQRFMNVLSKNIAINEEHLIALTETATRNAVLLCYSPLDYYEQALLENTANTIPYQNICAEYKYVRYHREIIGAIKAHMEKNQLQEITVEDFITILSEQLTFGENSYSPTLISQFNSVLEVSEEDFIVENTPPKQIQENPFFDSIAKDFQSDLDQLNTEDQANTEEQPPLQEDLKISSNTKEWIFEEPEKNEEKVFTLNDQLATKRQTSVAEKHIHKTQDSLMDSLSINLKFRFVNDLFNGQREQLNASLSQLDKCSNAKEAIEIIEKELIPYHSWDKKNETVKDFIEVIKKRFK